MSIPTEAPKQWPTNTLSTLGTDLATPVATFLRQIRDVDLKNKDGGVVTPQTGWRSDTPESLQVITAGVTALSKWWTGVVASVGGLGVIGTAVGAFYGKIGNNSALLFSLAIIIATAFGTVAFIVKADLMARALATQARKSARATIVDGFLNNYQYAKADPPPATVPPAVTNYAVHKNTGDVWVRVKSFAWDTDGLKLTTIDGDVLRVGQFSGMLDVSTVA